MDRQILRQVVNRGLSFEQVNADIVLENLTKARNQLHRDLQKDPSLLGSQRFSKVLDGYLEETNNEIWNSLSPQIANTLKEGQKEGQFIVGDSAGIPKDSAYWGWTPTLPINAIGLAESQAATLIQATTKELKEKILRATQVGLAGGMPLGEVQNMILGTGLKGMKGRDGVWRSATTRAEMQARTITNDLLNRGALLTYHEIDTIAPELKLQKVWQTVSDQRTSPRCMSLSGQIVGLNDVFKASDGWSGSHAPSHPNAYLPGSKVISVHGEVINRHWYDGQAIEIMLVNGVSIKVTADHPILTDRGFIEALEIRPSDNVFYNSSLDFNVPSHVAPEAVNHQVYPAIEDQFILCSVLRKLGFTEMIPAAVDLDKDPIYYEVDQILIESKIRYIRDALGVQNTSELIFKLRTLYPSGDELSGGFVDGILMSPFTGSPSLVSSLYPGFPFLQSQPTIEKLLALFTTSDLNTRFSQDSSNSAFVFSQILTYLITGNTRQIGLRDFRVQTEIQNPGRSSQFQITGIKEIRSFRYVGHVYNYTSKDGLNVANGILAHNCRSRITTLSEQYSKELESRFSSIRPDPSAPSPAVVLPAPTTPSTRISSNPSLPDPPPKTYAETLARAEQKYAENFAEIDKALSLVNEDKVANALRNSIKETELAMQKIANKKSKFLEFYQLDNKLEDLQNQLKERQKKVEENIRYRVHKLKQKLIEQGDEALALSKANATTLRGNLPFAQEKNGRFYQDNLTDLHRMSNNRVTDLEVLLYDDDRAWAARKGIQYTGDPDLMGRINVGNKVSAVAQRRTLYHEFGHHIEYSSDDVRNIANEFIRAKATSPAPEKLSVITGNPVYKDHERAYVGDYISPYVGKVYSNGDTEVIAMGLQQFSSLNSMLEFYQNHPDHFKLILGIL